MQEVRAQAAAAPMATKQRIETTQSSKVVIELFQRWDGNNGIAELKPVIDKTVAENCYVNTADVSQSLLWRDVLYTYAKYVTVHVTD